MDIADECLAVDEAGVALEGVVIDADAEVDLAPLQLASDKATQLELGCAVGRGDTCREVGLLAVEGLDGYGDGTRAVAQGGLTEARHGVYHSCGSI